MLQTGPIKLAPKTGPIKKAEPQFGGEGAVPLDTVRLRELVSCINSFNVIMRWLKIGKNREYRSDSLEIQALHGRKVTKKGHKSPEKGGESVKKGVESAKKGIAVLYFRQFILPHTGLLFHGLSLPCISCRETLKI